jgi:hypothetical protein
MSKKLPKSLFREEVLQAKQAPQYGKVLRFQSKFYRRLKVIVILLIVVLVIAAFFVLPRML